MERQRNSSLVGHLGCGFDPEPTPWINKKQCALQSNRGGFAKAGIRSQFKQCRKKGLKKKYKETVDSLSRSRVGVESNKDVMTLISRLVSSGLLKFTLFWEREWW